MSPQDIFSTGLSYEEDFYKHSKFGLTLAKITNITDEDKLNRVKCKPVVAEDEADVLETDWCPVVAPVSGNLCGQFFFPSVDDLVLLGYLNADPHCPYVIGGTWNADSPAKYTVEEGKNHNFSIRTPKGSELLFYDEEEKQTITLSTPKGAFLMFDDENEKVSISDKGAANTVILNLKDKMIDVTAEESIGLTCGSYSITLNKDGDVTITGKTVTIKGTDVKIEATNSFSAKGATAELKADSQVTVNGSGTVDVKGGMVNIN